MACCGQVYFGGSVWVIVIEVDVEEESSVSVWSAVRAHDESLHKINSILIASDIHRIGVFEGQGRGYVCELLGEPDHLGLVGCVVGCE